MNTWDKILLRAGLVRAKKLPSRARRNVYNASAHNRLTVDWSDVQITGDSALRNDIQSIRNRARQQERDNDYARRFYRVLENNVLGHAGIRLQVKARRDNLQFDKPANMRIEEAWLRWAKRGTCTANKEETWLDAQRLILRSAARDGSILVRIVRDRDVNDFAFSLQLIEIDHLDISYFALLPNGNYVCMGIEKDPKYFRTVAYHLFERHPGDLINTSFPRFYERVRVPALGQGNGRESEILHYFVRERPTQSIGCPWLASATTRLNHLNRYEEAELIASRAAASKGGWFENEVGLEYTGEKQNEGTASEATLSDFEPAGFEELPKGFKFVPYDPKHPTDAFPDMIKATLYGICAGADVSYATLTGDLSEANYSSMRSGKLEEQEGWKSTQSHFIQHVCEPIFEAWLSQALLTGEVDLPFSKFSTWNSPQFRGRRWPWVDPEKDINAKILAINNHLETRTDTSEEQGRDFEDTLETLAEEEELAKEYGLELRRQPEPVSASNAGDNGAAKPRVNGNSRHETISH